MPRRISKSENITVNRFNTRSPFIASISTAPFSSLYCQTKIPHHVTATTTPIQTPSNQNHLNKNRPIQCWLPYAATAQLPLPLGIHHPYPNHTRCIWVGYGITHLNLGIGRVYADNTRFIHIHKELWPAASPRCPPRPRA